MKKKLSFIILIVNIFLLTIGVVGCNSISGRNNNVYLTTFRHDGQFILPIKVSQADTPPDAVRHFKSKMSLPQMYNVLCEQSTFETEYCEDFILVKDLSPNKFGYCIIYPKQLNKFNYIANNMACIFQGDSLSGLEILTPVHLIPELIEDNVLIENKEYSFNSTQEALIKFYEEYGFEVTYGENSITVRDNIGRFLSGQAFFDDTLNSFQIHLRGGSISFKYLSERTVE